MSEPNELLWQLKEQFTAVASGTTVLETVLNKKRRSVRPLLVSGLGHTLMAVMLFHVSLPVKEALPRYKSVRLTAPVFRTDTVKPRREPERLKTPKRVETRPEPSMAGARELPAPPPRVPEPPPTPRVEDPPAVAPEIADLTPPPVNTGVFADATTLTDEPAPPAPRAQTGVFATAVATREAVRTNGISGSVFDTARLRLPSLTVAASDRTVVGRFGAAAKHTAVRVNGPRPLLSNGTAFGEYNGGGKPATSRSRPGIVQSASFGSTAFADTSTPPARASSPEASFGDVIARPATSDDRVQQNREVTGAPLEILHKPKAAYTEEARRLQIEGAVVLEVLFAASGEVRILRILHGLGHGLDENAVRAAQAIGFNPARRGSDAVDAVAVVRITFQLAY